MLCLTLLVLEGMARIAYYAAYGEGYGRLWPQAAVNQIAPPPHLIQPGETPEFYPSDYVSRRHITHPFYGFSARATYAELNAMPPRQRREDTVVIGLLGGSVAESVKPFLQVALNRRFAANELPRQPVVMNLAVGAARQPQQPLIVAHTLLLGGEFDLIVNLDGFNEVLGSAGEVHRSAELIPRQRFPFFPYLWRVGLSGSEILRVGHIGVLRREQARLTLAGETSPLRRSAFFGLLNRWRQERTAAQIIQRNHELATAADYSLEKHGPRSWPPERELFAAAARVWYRGSLLLARLAELGGADYYHFLQPNQYAPGSKPLSPEERKSAYAALSGDKFAVERGYPQLRAFNRTLQRQGVNSFDLTGIFADHPETLYIDMCCHLNDRGNELLAAAMAQRMAPALLRRGGARPAGPVSPLAAARRPAETNIPLNAPGFQVALSDNGKALRYVRADCAIEETEPLFFLHLTPRDLTALPPSRRESGFADVTFSFARIGGGFQQGQCVAQFPLPDYPLAALRTGQQSPGTGELWSTQLIVPPDPDQLRADYAALSAANPVARDYFDLYAMDNRLLYLRESCAEVDTANPFFLHLIPQKLTDLPAERREAGFAHAGFAFARHGGPFDGKCLAAVALPEYPIKEMRTGQHIPGQDAPLWSVALIAAPDLDQLRADYAALSAANPVIRDYFDLYWQDNQLLYFRETCAAADTAAGFFLHIVPEEITDLPAERRAAGFTHGGFEFVRHGGPFDGKCLASVPLPDYPIKEMRTGQHIPGQGDLWSVIIAAP